MASEVSYKVVLIHNLDRVPGYLACPKCRNDDTQRLAFDENDEVTCLSCGKHYSLDTES